MSSKFLVFVAILIFSSSLYALEFGATIKREGAKDSKQYCYTTFNISQSGEWSAYTKFSNGKTIDGDTFVAVMDLYSYDGEHLVHLYHRAGLNGTFGRGSVERVVPQPADSGRVSPRVATRIDESKTRYVCGGENTVDDKTVAAIIKSVIGF